MKTYKMCQATLCNLHCSKNGFKWRYRGKFYSISDAVLEAKKWTLTIGVRVIDCDTQQIVYEEMWGNV